MKIKHIILAIPFLINLYPASAQQDNAGTFLQTKSKNHLYYVDLNNSVANVYEMGRYFDKAGTGYSIRNIDTLIRQSNENYVGNHKNIVRLNNKFYLVIKQTKDRKYLIDTVESLENVNQNLNNAYYLDEYFKMSAELNKIYSLNHHSFRNGYYTWSGLTEKNMNYLPFRKFADKRIQYIKDSISLQQNLYVARTNHILGNLKTVDYHTLKDSLIRLPADYKSLSWYFGTVVNEIAKQRPEYFFRLAEDLPDNQRLMFMAVEDNKEVIQGLNAVDGHNEIKAMFFKDRRFEKTLPYRIIGVYAVILGLLTWVIVTQ